MKIIQATILLFLSCILPSYGVANSLSGFTFYAENYPPANYLEDNKLTGISVETMKALWQKLEQQQQEITVVPWARGYRFTLEKPKHVLMTMSRTPAREKLFKWVGPIFHSSHIFVAKKAKKLKFDNLGQSFSYRVASVRGDISEISLYEIGFPESNIAKVTQLKQAYRMLASDRVDMIVVSVHGFAHLAEQLGFDLNDYEQTWLVNKVGNYFAFNIETPDQVINQYQQAFDAIKEQRHEIKKKYELPFADY